MTDRYLSLPQPISLEVLQSLGLTKQDIDEYDPERIRRRKLAQLMLEQGNNAYEQTKSRPSDPIKIRFTGGPTIEFPRATELLASYLEHQLVLSTYRKVEDVFVEAKAFLDGFGTAALTDRNWVVAINTFEVLTSGGIQKNEVLMERLRTEAANDKATGIEIARAMQNRIINLTKSAGLKLNI